MAERTFSPRVLQRFAQTLSAEIGEEALAAVLEKSGLPQEWSRPQFFAAFDATRAARAYAQLQAALRTYYGRGARGTLLRIGSKLWQRLLDDAALGVKAQALAIRSLPKTMRAKPALDLLARMLSASSGSVNAYVQDLDLLLVDKVSASALDQTSDAPICFVTLGLARECLFWADGQEHDIEERACRALGAAQCEFKINIGG
ncbi:MAG: hypothetical protein Fur002_06850 [Anaerolineales bacterium]